MAASRIYVYLGAAVFAVLLFAVMPAIPQESDQTRCAANLKQLGQAFQMYCQDWDGYFPPSSGWTRQLLPYVRDTGVFNCPASPRQERLMPRIYSGDYSMNGHLYATSGFDRARMAAMPPRTPILYDCTGPFGSTVCWSLRNEPGTTPPSMAVRHNGGANWLWRDGSVTWMSVDELKRLYVCTGPDVIAFTMPWCSDGSLGDMEEKKGDADAAK